MSAATNKISRELAREYGQETVRILEVGEYRAASGRTVRIGGIVSRSVTGTCRYPPDHDVPESRTGAHATHISVTNETTLSAARALLDAGCRPAVLNFASATHAGGGFLTGARAQEEYLARSSGLYACLRDQPMYEFHRARHDPMYTNYAIYSPDVPVFRADDGTMVDEPYMVGIITSPAANASALPLGRHAEIPAAMWARVLKVLYLGIEHRHDGIVLGAWGCGAFGNDGAVIAGLFRKALAENFRGAYRRVTFAVVDWSPEQRFIGPFKAAFSTPL
jgi:uncharacterized protein (TIGR02452 family)